MSLHVPILIIEDDLNDADAIIAALSELGVKNKLIHFDMADKALAYLAVTKDRPMVILCDIRMPAMDGLAFLKTICSDEFLRSKSIPFVFLTAIVTPEIISEAYKIGVQGFYRKASSYTALKDQLLTILVYWKQCLHPSSEFAEMK